MKYIVSYSVEKEIDKKPELFYGFSEWYLNINYRHGYGNRPRTRDVKFTKQFVQINLKQFN